MQYLTASAKFGDIFLCEFPFTDGIQSKLRPSLVLQDFGEDVLICRITSVPHNETGDVKIVAWEKSGLLKPSTIRLCRLVTIEKSLLLRKIGEQSETDKKILVSLWNNTMLLK